MKTLRGGGVLAVVALFLGGCGDDGGSEAAGRDLIETFDDGVSGWRVAGDGSEPEHVAEGGEDGGGWLRSSDRGLGVTWYWQSPTEWAGDRSGFVGGSLRFVLAQADESKFFENYDVLLSGDDRVIGFTHGDSPSTTWTSFVVPLVAEGWEDTESGEQVGDDGFEAVLSDLDDLQIRGEYRTGGDTGGLDEVTMTTEPADGESGRTAVSDGDPPLADNQNDEDTDGDVIALDTSGERAVDPPLIQAVFDDDLDLVDSLIDSGEDPDVGRESDGATPLLVAAQEGHDDIVERLLEEDVNLDRGSDDDFTPLMIAAQNGHVAVIELLLEAGANPAIGRSTNFTALHSAAGFGHADAAAVLIEGGVPLEAAEDGFTALTFAAQEGFDNVAQVLIDSDADLQGSAAGPSPVFMAAQNSHVSTLELLLEADADPDDGGANSPPVIIAADRGLTDVLGVLIDAGADVDLPRDDGATALHFATNNNDTDVAQLLLDAGASTTVEDDQGRTPADIAEAQGSDEVAALLRDA